MNFLRNILLPADARKALFLSFLIIVIIWVLIKLSIPVMEDFLVIDKPLPHADALVVMAGSTSERLPAAAFLFKKGVSQKILLTNDGVLGGWSEEKNRNLYHVEWAESALIKVQVPEKAIVKLSYTASGSIYDALNSRTAILDKGMKSIIIVTSDYHTRRSLWTFERVFRDHPVSIGVFPAKSEVSTMSDLNKFKEFTREMIKFAYYWIKYNNSDKTISSHFHIQ